METGLDLSMIMDMVASEMVQGKEVARKLMAHIDSGCSIETCRSLVLEMLSFFDKSILMVKSSADGTESPGPLTKSPRGESTGRGFEDQQSKEIFKKR